MDLIFLLFDKLLVDPMANVLVGLARLFGGNFGIAIIVFTIVMRLITWPLTSSQYKQSRAMQSLQPKMQELQKKYKGKDPKKLQAETMSLYREHGVNPLGCLVPMLVQFPIWIALYQVISRTLGETPESLVGLSQQLYPVDFLRTAVPLNNHLLYWNLGQPDTSFVLPVIVGLTMYVQQKMITPAPQGPLTPQQMQQQQTQQMMTWMLPLVFGYFSLTVPSGLALYWAVSNLAGIVTQYFYLGRRVDWRNMMRLSPQMQRAPAAVRSGDGRPAAKPVREVAARSGPAADVEEATPSVSATDAGPQARRKRNGRRRGKR